jgi:hypothetical protein
MSIPQCLLQSRDVRTPPVDYVLLSFPQCLPCGPQSNVKKSAAVLFADDNKHEDNVVAAPAFFIGCGGSKI